MMFPQLRSRQLRQLAIAALTGLGLITSALPQGRAEAAPWSGNRTQFATAAFNAVWDRADAAVAQGRVSRSWTWGPGPWFDYKEFYIQSPNGLRQVQYFDKARMEINNPRISDASGVTNGLLTVELVSGRLKVGDSIGPEQNLERAPAQVPVAGDPANENPNAPTYASFRGVATIDNGYRDPDKSGQRIGSVLDKGGNLTTNAALAQDPQTTIVAYNTVTGHNVPRVFRDFIQNGPIEGVFAFGYPITDPYWIKARVGGVEKDVFVQLYERRVVTYTPSNPAAFRVEMGNVGQHYFQWRYPHLGQPWQPNADRFYNLPLAYASRVDDDWQVFTADTNGNSRQQITAGTEETVPYAWRRSYIGGAMPRLMTDSRRVNATRKVFSIATGDFRDVRQHTASGDPSQYFNPAVSPDGTIIAVVIQGEGFSALALQPFDREQTYSSQIFGLEPGCIYQSPSWLPDGSGLVYAANCGNKFALYRADLKFNYISPDAYAVEAVNVRALTNTPNADNYFPRVSPDGSRIVFSSNREGQGEIYVINIDGSGERRLTSANADDGAATWSPDGSEIIFDSNRDGDYELYRMNISNTGVVTQITNNTIDDRWPIWFQ